MSRKAGPAGTLTSTSPIPTRWQQNSRRAMSSWLNHSRTTMMVCVDSNSRTLTATFCFSVVLVHERQFTSFRPECRRGIHARDPSCGKVSRADGGEAEDRGDLNVRYRIARRDAKQQRLHDRREQGRPGET